MELQKISLDSPTNKTTKTTTTQTVTPMEGSKTNSIPMKKITPVQIVGLIIALGLGLGTGYLLKGMGGTKSMNGSSISQTVPQGGLKEGDIVGVPDEKTFKDSATGYLDKGGLDGEGSHKLLRPGGPSQTVYLTSSVIDLDDFVGHQVTVWGETFKGQKAAWLMDVGRVKVEKLNAELPQ